MPPLNNPEITKGERTNYGQRYHITAEQGYADVDFNSESYRYRISYYEVYAEYIGRGYGKELLKHAKEHAREVGARVITSSNIISDESAGAVAAVFDYKNMSSRTDPKTVTSLVDLFSEITLEYPLQQ